MENTNIFFNPHWDVSWLKDFPDNIIIYHNPECGTSRNTLAMIRNSGVEPQIIYYLETPPTLQELTHFIEIMGMPVRSIIREKTDIYSELNLNNPDLSEQQLLEYMVANPILINRPIVATSLGIKLCRPSEVVLSILPNPQQNEFTKEDGEKVNINNK